jgi:hypothetical protein
MSTLTYDTAAGESRNEAFTAGATTHYENRGVLAMEENVPSALSAGLSPSDSRTSVFRGQRYVMTPANGRSASTSQTSPVFEQEP